MTNSSIADTSAYTRIEVDETTTGSHPALADNPRLTNPYCQLIRELQVSVQQAIDSLDLNGSSRVLDYGCSTMRYRHMFPADAEYVGADLPGNELADVLLDDEGRIPVASASFDVVFSTQVLEHVEEPALYLEECKRVLKPGGSLILSTHGTFVFHPCPSDYWRWTEMGLRRIMQKAELDVISVRGILGGLGAALQFLQDETARKLPRLLRPLYFALIQSLIKATDRFYTAAQRKKNACIFLMVAKSPG